MFGKGRGLQARRPCTDLLVCFLAPLTSLQAGLKELALQHKRVVRAAMAAELEASSLRQQVCMHCCVCHPSKCYFHAGTASSPTATHLSVHFPDMPVSVVVGLMATCIAEFSDAFFVSTIQPQGNCIYSHDNMKHACNRKGQSNAHIVTVRCINI